MKTHKKHRAVTLLLTTCMIVSLPLHAGAVNVIKGTSGDVDNNAVVNTADARICLKAAVGFSDFTFFNRTAADTDCSGRITPFDARTILRMAVGLMPINAREQHIAQSIVTPPHALLYDVTENRILFAKNEYAKVSPASITKLLTALTALDYVSPDAVFTVGDEIDLIGFNSSVAYLQKGWRMPLKSVIAGLLASSGNDAAYTIAVNTAKRLGNFRSNTAAADYFVGLMNQKAASLGMTDSHFMNPDGYDENGQYTTVRDLLTLSRAALANSTVAGACDQYKEYGIFASGGSVNWENTNLLLDPASYWYYPGACGLKTGSTNSAGCCLSAVYKDNARTLISIVMGCEDDAERYGTTIALFDLGRN